MTTKIFVSEYYGAFNIRRLGMLDVRLSPDQDFLFKWTDKFHPRRYFGSSFSYEQLKDERFQLLYENVVGWDIWVPTKADNIGWKSVPGTKYYEFCPKAKSLPIAISEAKVQKWLAATAPLLVKEA